MTTAPQQAASTTQQAPAGGLDSSFSRYVLNELKKIGTTIQTLAAAAIQAVAAPPSSPLVGTVRYATGDWATSLGGEGWYGYESTGWVPVGGVSKKSAFNSLAHVAITSTSPFALGLNLSITPSSSGTVVVVASGVATVASSANLDYSIRYGTGTPPAAGTNISSATTVGQVQGPLVNSTPNLAWSLNGLITGLTVGTKYWFDVAFNPATSITTNVYQVNGTAYEL